MASLENVQGANNSQDVNLGNVSSSNDTLSAAAMAIAKGREAGWSDEETLSVLSRRRRHQQPIRMTNREQREARQRFASITDDEGKVMPAEPESGVRSLLNEQVQFQLDGGERDQSAEDAYYGRDENEFTRWNKDRGGFEDVYIRDGLTTPDDLRDQALLRAYGLQKRAKVSNNEVVKEPLLDKRGKAIRNQDGEVIMRSTYDIENVNETMSGQGWQQGGGRAAAAAVERLDGTRTGSPASRNAVIARLKEAGTLNGYSEEQIDALAAKELAERRRRVFGDEAPTVANEALLRENLRRTADPQHAKEVESFFGRRAVQRSGENFSPAAKAISDARAARDASAAIVSGQAGVDEANYIPGSLTKYNVDPERGTSSVTLRAEPDSIFGARPQAVIQSEEAVEIARSLGDDVSAYVDIATGEGVQGITPSRLQTNLPNTSQQVNAPVTAAASWAASNLKEGKTGDVLADTNISQITADFSRRVEANAPGYRSRPVRSLDDFAVQVQRVIDSRASQGKNFYEPAYSEDGEPIRLKSGRQKQNKVTDPGISDVLRLLRMTSGEQGELANALYTIGMSGEGSRPVSAFSDGVQVTTGSMFGEKLDVGVAGRDTQRAAFAKAGIRPDAPEFDDDGFMIDYGDAQRPQIGAIRERDEFGGVTREEPQLKRAVMKGRSPDEAVATYRAQRKKNRQPVDEAYAEKIRSENESLRRDQAATEETQAVNRVIQQAGAGPLPQRQVEDEQFFSTPINKYNGSYRKGREPGGALVSLRKPDPAPTETPTQYYDGSSKFDVATNFSERSPVVGTNAVAPPPGQTEAVAPDPVSSALKREIAARLDQKRQARKRHIGGAVGVGAGLSAVMAALNGGKEEEQF